MICSIIELEQIKEEMCDIYCKWPEKCRTGKPEEDEITLHEHCKYCPLERL